MNLSVIVPMYNTRNFVEATIRSVLAEEIPGIEVIVVNDCSTDDSLAVVSRAFSHDSRVKIIDLKTNTPGGAGAPSNIGIEAARGNYIAFLDSDDWIVKGYFRDLLDSIVKLDCDLAIGGYSNIDACNLSWSPAYDHDVWQGFDRIDCPVPAEELLIFSPEPWRKVYKRTLFDNELVRFPVTGYVNEDYPFHWFCCITAKEACVVRNSSYSHRIERRGQTTFKNEERHSSFFVNSNIIFDAIKNHGSDVHWKYFQSWLERHSWILAHDDDKAVREDKFLQYSDLIRRIPIKPIDDVLAERIGWREAVRYSYLYDGDYSSFIEFETAIPHMSRRDVALQIIRTSGVGSFLKIYRARKNKV